MAIMTKQKKTCLQYPIVEWLRRLKECQNLTWTIIDTDPNSNHIYQSSAYTLAYPPSPPTAQMLITPQPSSSPIQIISLSRFESESLLAPEPSTTVKLLLVNWRRDLATAQQLAYTPSPPTAQMLIMPQPSDSASQRCP